MSAQPRARDNILNTALQLFAEQGFVQTSTDDIVKAAKVSKGLIFYHFQSKEGLLHMIFKQALTHLEIILPDPKEIPPSERALHHIIDFMLASLASKQSFWRLHYGTINNQFLWNEVVPKEVHSFWDAYFEFLIKSFKEMGAKEPQIMAETFDTFRIGLFYKYLQIGDEYPAEKMRKKWKNLISIT